jgi:feruloyl esterase
VERPRVIDDAVQIGLGGAGRLSFAGFAAVMLAGAAQPADRCAALARLSGPRMTIEAAENLSGRFTAPDGTSVAVTPVCRVRGIARPTPASRITFELWLPRSGWNERFYQIGNGGFAGNIDYPSLASEAARGNAVAITDTGHSGTQFDASWAVGQPERVVDYGHRSIKATADAARALVSAYYGMPPRWRYFAGCSGGGRQALMAAQRYPDDWDGVLAGAPANIWMRQLVTFARLQQHLRRPGAWIAAAKLPSIQRAALASCPSGSVVGGVATNPESCRFDPASLVCRTADSPNCLTPVEAAMLRRLQQAGFEPSAAAYPESWTQWILNLDPVAPSQHRFATEAFRYLVRNDPDWRVELFDPRRDRPSRSLREAVDSDSTDLARFRARGGRILSYFGWADPVLSPRAGLAYYRRVVQRMGGAARTRDFYRLFMVPGMTHCQGGLGPDSFGQSMVSPPLRPDAAHDIRLALERWVEQGVAPGSLVAVRYRHGDPRAGVTATQILRPAQ